MAFTNTIRRIGEERMGTMQPAQKPAVKPLAPMGAQPPASPAPVAPTMQPQPAPVAPPPMVPGGVPPVTGAALSTINPQQDLRHQTITPDNAGAPNLTQLAQDRYKDMLAGTADERQKGIRAIGQGAAKFGRIGAGMTTNELTSLEDLLERRENETARDLAFGSATGDLNERRSQRGELRGERDYQLGLDNSAQDRAIQQVMLQDSLMNSEWGRQMGQANMQYGAGADRQASGGDALQSLAEYLFQRQAGKKPGQSSPEPVDTSNILYSPY